MTSTFTRPRGFIATLAAGVVAISLLLGASTAQAATIVRDGDVATGITNLTIGGNTYDVQFTCNTTSLAHWGNPPQFDFTNKEDAYDAVTAIVATFNAEGGVLAVGCGTGSSDFSPWIFRLGFGLEDIEIDPPILDPINVKVLLTQEGVTGDTKNPGVWAPAGDSPGDFDVFPWGDDTVSPLFTLVSSGGPSNKPPTADANGPYEGVAGSPVSFDGSASSDLDGNIVSHEWTFGDGNSATGESPTHTYATADRFNVTLTVTDDAGDSSSDSTQAVIGENGEPPVADAGGPYTGTVDKPVRFDGSGSEDADGPIATFLWDFGDGNQSNAERPVHTYTATGKYTVTLTVTDDDGETDKDTADATIGLGNLPPTADAGGPYGGTVGEAVNFDGSGSDDPDGDILSYDWNFDDGTFGSGPSPSHVYSEIGNYTVTLTVTDDDGVPDSNSTTTVITRDLQPIRAVLALSDANDNGSPDVALVRKDPDDRYRAYVYDGGTGGMIRTLDFGTSPTRGAVVVERASGPDDIAAMQRLDDGSIRVLVKNTGTGDTVANLQYGDAYNGIDLSSGDIDGDGSPEVGVVGEDANKKNRIFYKNVDSGAVVAKLFQSATNRSRQLLTVPTVNGGTAAEAAVSGVVRDSGASRVRVQDTGTATILQNLNFGTQYPSLTAAVIPDAAGAGQAGIADMGVHVDTGKTRIQNRDAATGAVLTTSFIRNTQTAIDLSAVSDVNQDNQVDIAALVASEADKGSVWIFDAATGAQISTVPMTPINDPTDLAISADLNGNGSDELLGLGERDDGADRIAIFDSVTGDNILLINVP